MHMETTTTRKGRTHYLGSTYASRTACGRMVITYMANQPNHSDNKTEVDCAKCKSTFNQ